MPIYAQIAEAIRREVAVGCMRPGEQLPTVRQLAVDLRINPNTVARAYSELERDGVIATKQGRGTFILDRPVKPKKIDPSELHRLARQYLAEARRLGFDGQDALEACRNQLTAASDPPSR